MKTMNIFSKIPPQFDEEVFENILQNNSFQLERIVSRGQATPKGQWYNQDRDEWVILLQGSAALKIEGHDELLKMRPGDHVHLPANLKHRVEWTDAQQTTIWLALHYKH